MSQTPIKYLGEKDNCFFCSKVAAKKERLLIFGKSSVDLKGLVDFALEINLSNNHNPDVYVCKQCYDKLKKLQNARKKVEELKRELNEKFKESRTRLKRLNKPEQESSAVVEKRTAKSRSFDDTPCTSSQKLSHEINEREVQSSTSSISKILFEPLTLCSTNALEANVLPLCPLKTSTPTSSPAKNVEAEIKINYPSRAIRKSYTVNLAELEKH